MGKSTLLNRLAKRRIALVHDMPGVTRDWKETLVEIGGQTFQLLDAAGLEEVGKIDALSDRMTAADTPCHGSGASDPVYD